MAKFYIEKNESVADALMNPDNLMAAQPEYYGPRFQAIADLRSQDDGTLHRGNEFRRVASFVNVPMFQAVQLMNPEFINNKKKFYQWLRTKGKRYMTYDARGGSRPSVTVVDGKAVN